MELKQHLIPQLKALRLSGILDTLEVRTQQALSEQWTYGDFLERLLEDEVERRGQKQLAMRLRRASETGSSSNLAPSMRADSSSLTKASRCSRNHGSMAVKA